MMVVLVTAPTRVAVEITTSLFNCIFCGVICGVSSGSDISWVVIVLW